MSKKVQFIGIGLQGNEFVKNHENSPLVTSFHYIEQLTEVMAVDTEAFTLLFVENNERDLQLCYQFAKSFQFDCLSVVVLPTRGESLHSHCHKWLLDLEKRIDLLIALNKPLQVECMLLKETDLFDAITVIIDLISANNLISVDVEDIKTVSYGAKEIGFYSFEIERKGDTISADDVITHLLSKSHKKIKEMNGAVISITSDENLLLDEYHMIMESISSLISEDCTIVASTNIKHELGNIIELSIVAAY